MNNCLSRCRTPNLCMPWCTPTQAFFLFISFLPVVFPLDSSELTYVSDEGEAEVFFSVTGKGVATGATVTPTT